MHSILRSTLPAFLRNSNDYEPVSHHNKAVCVSTQTLAGITREQPAQLHKVSLAKAMNVLVPALAPIFL